MISFAPELDLTFPVPGTANCAWVTVGRGDGGSEELRDKLVMGAEKECWEEDPLLHAAWPVSICLNFANGDICLSFTGLLEDVVEDESVDAEEKGELSFARVGLDLHLGSAFPLFTSNSFSFSGTCSLSYLLSLLIKLLSQSVVFWTACPATSSGLAGVTKLVKLCCLFWAKPLPSFSHCLILIFSCLALGGLLISASADLLFQKPIRLLVRDILFAALSLYGVTLSNFTSTDVTDYNNI